MTAATLISPACTASHEGCSSIISSEPLIFPIVTGEQQGMSFDWSDFGVLYQYNHDHPVPAAKPVVPAHYFAPSSSSSSSPLCCEHQKPTFAWELDSDESFYSSSSDDEDTDSAVEASSSLQEGDKTHKKSVAFSDIVDVRSYQVVLGEHPCCSSLAMELGWEHEDEVIDLDLFESCRTFQRRHLSALRLSYWERRNVLEMSTGLSEPELLLQEQRAWREFQWPSAAASEATNNNSKKDKAPILPQKSSSCSQETCLRKIASTKTLSALV